MTMQNYPSGNRTHDTFICHASEDKESIARPLAQSLMELGVNTWFDEIDITLGESIRRKIDQGLANARSVTAILSRPFFLKDWTQYEMDGVIERHVRGETILIPIWHAITPREIRDYSPSVADIRAITSSELTIPEIAAQIAERIGRPPTGTATHSSHEQSTVRPTPPQETNFGVFYIAPEGTAELPVESEPDPNPMMLFSEPAGWIPMVSNKEELEYITDGRTLRFRLEWGNRWEGTELQAAQLATGRVPIAITIRSRGRDQTYFPSVTNQNPKSPLMGEKTRSGWMTFLIG